MSEHELWNELGNLYFISGSYDQAIHAYTRSVALDRNFGKPYSNMALAYAQKGKYLDAIDLYQLGIKLLKDDQEKAWSWFKLGNVYRHLKDYRRAVDAYERADALDPDLRENERSSNKADALLNRKPTFEDALQLLDKPPAVEQNETVPHSPASQESDQNVLLEELTPWRFDEEIVPEEEPALDFELWSMDQAGVVGPDDNIIFTEPLKWDLSNVYDMSISTLEPQVAVVNNDETVTTASVSNVNNTSLGIPGLVSSTGDALLNASQQGMQEHQVLEVDTLEVEPSPIPVLVVASEVEVMTETPEFVTQDITDPEAVQYKTHRELPVVELTPEELAVITADIDKYKRVLEINPRNAFAWDTIGGLYKAAGQYDEAIVAYQKTVSLDGSKAFYFYHLGLVYAAVGRYEDAIAVFQKVIEIDSNYSLAYATLGGYYRKKGMEELAQEHIEKARSLLADDENEYNRACMEAICGNSDRALELLELALKNKQTYVNWARRDPDLDFIRSDPRFHALLAEYATKTAQ